MQSVFGYLRGKEDQRYLKKPSQRNDDPYPDTMELEKERERGASLNRQKGIFDRPEEGLNKTQSVFDRTAIFHVEK